MRKREYTRKLSALTDSELYTEAKKSIMDNMLGIHYDTWKGDLILEECIDRNNDIYSNAIEDSVKAVDNLKSIGKGMIVSEVFKDTGELKNFLPSAADAVDSTDVLKLIGSENIIFCHVAGESMIDENIMSGDILIVDKNTDDFNDRIVIVSVNSVMFVKRFKIIDNEKWLFSGNEKYKPVKITSDMDFRIIGAVRMKLQNVN